MTQDVSLDGTALADLVPSDAGFRTLVEEAPIAVSVTRDFTTIAVNAAFLRLFGYETAVDVVGHPTSRLYAGEDRDGIGRVADGSEAGAASAYEAVGLRRDGTTFACLVNAAVVAMPDGPASVAFYTDLTELRQAQADLALAMSVRSSLADAVRDLPDHATTAETAALVCKTLSRLPGADVVAVFGFTDELRLLGCEGVPRLMPTVARSSTARSRVIRATTAPWASAWEPLPDDGPWARALTAAGIHAVAYSPIGHAGHVDGAIAIATLDPAFGRTLVERFAPIADLSGPSSALLAERLHAWRLLEERHVAIAAILAGRAFYPVFQPIVALSTKQVVGYEALTRFQSSERPERIFRDAGTVGLGLELELATLEAAVAVSDGLPTGSWLDLNVSPDLLLEPRLKTLLSEVRRPLVVEVTEHEPVADYAVLHAAVRGMDRGVWLAVDDAGAGIANFNHIVELRPDLVKLDVSLVRGVDTDPGRQALVVAMVRFAKTTHASLVAEGIETAAEAAALQRLGIAYGQGHHLGRPETIDEIERGMSGGRPSGTLTVQWLRGIPKHSQSPS